MPTRAAARPSCTRPSEATLGGAFKSTDEGEHWQSVNEGLSASHLSALAVLPQAPETLYAGGYGVRSARPMRMPTGRLNPGFGRRGSRRWSSSRRRRARCMPQRAWVVC